jgi:HAMP domain-containing protein
VAPASGTDAKGNAVLTTSSLVPKLGWHVFFEQETAQALTPIRDQLVRIALLIGLGLVVAIIAGTIMARRMLVPITALRAGARRLGAGDFGHRIEVKTSDELEELANQFNGMAGQLAETYSNLEAKVNERTRDLAQSINELKVLEEVGRAVASSLDLNAVLPTVAARALEITHADAVLIYGYDAGNHQFSLTESIGIDQAAEGGHRAIDADNSPLGEAASTGEPIAIPQLGAIAEHPLRDVALEGRLQLRAGGAAGRPDRHSGLAGGAAAERRRILRQSDRPDEDLCAPGGAGDAQCAAVHRGGPQEPRASGRQQHRAASRPTSCRNRPTSSRTGTIAGGARRDPARRDRAHPAAGAFPGAAGGATDRLLRRP